MATRPQHLKDAATLKTSQYNLDDWSSSDYALFDKWIFKGGKWDSLTETWFTFTNKRHNAEAHMACYLAYLLAKENNTP